MAKRRKFTSEFKTVLVLEVLRGETPQAELCQRHHLNADPLSKWKQQFLEKAPSLFDTTEKQSSELQKRIAPLEHLVGRTENKSASTQSRRCSTVTVDGTNVPRDGSHISYCARRWSKEHRTAITCQNV